MSVAVEEIRTDFGPSESQSRRKGPVKKFWGVQSFKKSRIFSNERELPRPGTIFHKYILKLPLDKILELSTTAEAPVNNDEKQRSSSLHLPITEMQKQLTNFLERYPKQYEKSTTFKGIENSFVLKSPASTPLKANYRHKCDSDQMVISKTGTDENIVKEECLKLINNLKKRKADHIEEPLPAPDPPHVYTTANTSPFKRRKILSPFKQEPQSKLNPAAPSKTQAHVSSTAAPSKSQLASPVAPLKAPHEHASRPVTPHSLKYSDLKSRTPSKCKTATAEPKRVKHKTESGTHSHSTHSTPARPALIPTSALTGRTVAKTQFKAAPLHPTVPLIQVTSARDETLNPIDLLAVDSLANLVQSAKSTRRQLNFDCVPDTKENARENKVSL